MPFKSKAQHRWMRANHPKMAERWAHHTKDIKSLPEHVGDKSSTKEGNMITKLAGDAAAAATDKLVAKLAADTKTGPEAIRYFAGLAGLPVADFVKVAYDDPDRYVEFLKQAVGIGAAAGPAKEKVLELLRNLFSQRKATSGVGQFMQRNSVLGGTQAGRIGTGAAAAGGAGLAASGAMGGGAKANPAQQAPQASPAPEATAPGSAGVATPKMQEPMSQNGPAANGGNKTLLAGLGGAAAGAAGALGMQKLRKKKPQDAMQPKMACDAVRNFLARRAVTAYKQAAARAVSTMLDDVAASLPMEKAAAVRTLQAGIAAGKPLADAIKVAYPHLTGENRGIMASRLVRSAIEFDKKAGASCKTQEKSEYTGPVGAATKQLKAMS